MRRLAIAILLALSLAAPAMAASLGDDRMAAIDKAADAFLAKAAEAKKAGMVLRQTDPAVAPLLDTVFDTGPLGHGTIDFADEPKLIHWLNRLDEVGGVYTGAARATHDTGLFGAEIGRFLDAAASVIRAMVDSRMAQIDAHPEVKPSAADQQNLARLRAETAKTFGSMVETIEAPGITVNWAQDRIAALVAAAPSLARFLAPEQLAHLRASVLRLAARFRQKTLRQMLDRLAVALAEPAPPLTASTAPPAENEIMLEADGRNYLVPVRINGSITAKFVVDSGASVVMLPKDMVEDLVKSGAIVSSDMHGRSVFVTADGKHHKGQLLMLRRLEVGGHVATDVMAGVGPEHVEPLLGQTFLAKFKSWTLDNKRHVLILGE